MDAFENSVLKIYVSSTDRVGSELLYEYLVGSAKQSGIAGVTVYKGIMGYGESSSKVQSSRFWELTEKLPVVIEMTDKTTLIEMFYNKITPVLENMPKGCLVTVSPVEIRFHKSGKGK